MPNIPGPLIQGYAVGRNDYTVSLNGVYFLQNLQELDWSGGVTEELVYGLDQSPIGRTLGQYTPEAINMTLLYADSALLKSFLMTLSPTLGQIGYNNAVCPSMSIVATPATGPAINVLLQNVRWLKCDDTLPNGTAAATAKWTGSWLRLRDTGNTPVGL